MTENTPGITDAQRERLEQLQKKVAENKAMTHQERIELQHLQRRSQVVVVKKPL